MNQFLIILRGVPASGKTTIAKEFRNFDKKIAWLKVDNFKEFFADDSSGALDYVNGSAIATLEYLFNQGFSVIMDGVFQETNAIDNALILSREKNIKAIVYQIKCSLSILQERDRTRPGVKEGHRKPLGDDVIARIYQKLETTFYPNAEILDTEKLALQGCVEKINKDITKSIL
jgi:tRNA uridine 5-carbamoylmethylation protein Kti12